MELDPALDYSDLDNENTTVTKSTMVSRDKRVNAVSRLFKRLNPATWFDDFSNIEIKLEEPDLQKP